MFLIILGFILVHSIYNKETSVSEKGLAVISSTVKLRGNICALGKLEINGYVNGMIKMDGELIIRQGAKVEGEIETLDVFIEGQINGNIKVANKVSLGRTSVISGNITAKILVIEEGAKYSGKIEMTG